MSLAYLPRPTTPTTPALPRLEHIESHVRSDLHPLLRLLLEPLNIDEIAERLGPGYTRRYVEPRMSALSMVLPIVSPRANHIFRLALLRIAMGLDDCWCEP